MSHLRRWQPAQCIAHPRRLGGGLRFAAFVGADLVRFRGVLAADYETVGWSGALVAAQATIIACARKLKRQSPAA